MRIANRFLDVVKGASSTMMSLLESIIECEEKKNVCNAVKLFWSVDDCDFIAA